MEIQHLNLRRFVCQICDSKFGRRSTLVAHIRTHTGEKAFKCKIEGCEKRFAEKGNMEMHYKRHLKRISGSKADIEDKKEKITFCTIEMKEDKESVSFDNLSNENTRPPSDINLNFGSENAEMLKEENDFWKNDDKISVDNLDNVFNTNFMQSSFDIARKESNMSFVNNDHLTLLFD